MDSEDYLALRLNGAGSEFEPVHPQTPPSRKSSRRGQHWRYNIHLWAAQLPVSTDFSSCGMQVSGVENA
ncbi:unnamed protein product [Amoebophrya sp. A25]|nr:unnamed protein product [Amoebophrya sp. A25]|eukprot:GSA25T00014853001.1